MKGPSSVRNDHLDADFERLLAELARRARHSRFEPNADVYVDFDRGQIVVHVEVAGADAERLRVGIDEQQLVIVGTRTDRSSSAGSLHQKEIAYGDFVKRLYLPAPVDENNGMAAYRDGILTISLPLAPHAAFPTRRTEIRMVVQRTLA